MRDKTGKLKFKAVKEEPVEPRAIIKGRYECMACSKSFKSSQALSGHMVFSKRCQVVIGKKRGANQAQLMGNAAEAKKLKASATAAVVLNLLQGLQSEVTSGVRRDIKLLGVGLGRLMEEPTLAQQREDEAKSAANEKKRKTKEHDL